MAISQRDAINPSTCADARALLGWSADDLAGRSGIALPTITNFESGRRQPRYKTITALLRAFGGAGIVFVAKDDGQPTVRFARDDDVPQTGNHELPPTAARVGV